MTSNNAAYRDIKGGKTDFERSAVRDIPTKQVADYRPPHERQNNVFRDCPKPPADPKSKSAFKS
jgi:hypothetical protein